MKLVLFNNTTLLTEITIPDQEINHLSFGLGVVKEIVFSCPANGKNQFEYIYNELQKTDYSAATDIYIHYTKNQFYHFHSTIKSLLYRTTGYVNAGHFEINEILSIRLVEDIKPLYTETGAICDIECDYLNNGACTRFNSILLQCPNTNSYFITKNCFLEGEGLVRNNVKLELLEKLREELESNL